VLASTAQTLAELASGRIQIWIGRGDAAVYSVGLPHATVRQMREFILTLKSLLAGETVNFNGTVSHMRMGGGTPVPIYLAADGPKTIALAGEVADGLILRVALHPKVLDAAQKSLAEGAQRAGRDPAEIDVIYLAQAIIRDDMEEAREMARPHCVRWLMMDVMARGLREAGIDLDRLEMPKELRESRPEAMQTLNMYPDLHHAEDWEMAKRLCAFVPPDVLAQICDVLGFIGTPEHCAQRLQEAYGNGIDHLYLAAAETYAFPHTELRAFEETIFPAIASIR
jgi:5,10-methylenetetrahydromethanopterin reductase